jgi:DNA-binding NtrC family response regulator
VTPRPRVVVEDDALVSEVLRAILDEHYEVVCAASAKEALAELAHRRADAVLLDYCLPGGGGRDLAERAGAPVVWMTGHPDAIRALREDSRPLLPKPFDASAVLGTLAETLALP